MFHCHRWQSALYWFSDFLLTDTSEDSILVQRRLCTEVNASIFFSFFFRRLRATSMTQRRVEDTCVHFWTFLPVSVNFFIRISSRFQWYNNCLPNRLRILNSQKLKNFAKYPLDTSRMPEMIEQLHIFNKFGFI